VADGAVPGLPLRADPGTSAGAPPSRGVRNDRQQSGEGRGRQPVTEAEGAAPFGSWAELEAIVGPSPGGPAEFPKTEASVRAVPGNHAAVPVVARMWADTASAMLAFSERGSRANATATRDLHHERRRQQPDQREPRPSGGHISQLGAGSEVRTSDRRWLADLLAGRSLVDTSGKALSTAIVQPARVRESAMGRKYLERKARR
jgi:hypothetical protein